MSGSATLFVSTAQGAISLNLFDGVFGGSVDDLLASEAYPDSPTQTRFAESVDYNESNALRGMRFVGYLHPELDGYYFFCLSGKDDSRLFLSLDETPELKVEIINRGQGGYQDFSEPWFGSFPLEAGKKYYLEVLGKVQWGGGHLSAAWQHESWPEPQLIGSANLSTLIPSGPIAIETPPASQTVLERSQLTLTVEASGTPPYAYQWQKDGVDLAGATDASLVIDRVSLDDAGDYTVKVSNRYSEATSEAASIEVLPGGGAGGPQLVSAGSFDGVQLGLRFDSPLDPATVSEAGNYQVFAGGQIVTVTGAAPGNDPATVIPVLNLPSTLSNPFTVMAEDLKDANGVVMGAPGLVRGAVQDLTLTDIGSPVEAGAANAFGPDEVEVTAGGLRTWDTSDSFTFVHGEPMTGDFDVRVRIDSVEQLGTPGGDPKAALMARENLTAGSPNVSLNAVSTRNYIEYLYRPSQDGGT
ncbi:MAG: immunoglobulin domain-containing protein, partial [Verrucomicrobiae bacterium]|nr:immunoglobulin domain-containing protein [Verrucomicrobiae bacterium]